LPHDLLKGLGPDACRQGSAIYQRPLSPGFLGRVARREKPVTLVGPGPQSDAIRTFVHITIIPQPAHRRLPFPQSWGVFRLSECISNDPTTPVWRFKPDEDGFFSSSHISDEAGNKRIQ